MYLNNYCWNQYDVGKVDLHRIGKVKTGDYEE